MKKFIYLVSLSVIFFISCKSQEEKTTENGTEKKDSATVTQLTIKGSETCLQLMDAEVHAYGTAHKDANISLAAGGSGVGITALIDGTTDLAMSSREMEIGEKLKLTEKKKELKEVHMAYDALSVVVHPKNKVDKLSREQLEDIFTGKITNWKEVGGADKKIVVYSRESSSGTYKFFMEHVMKKKNYAHDVLQLNSPTLILENVGNNEGAIGYVGISTLSEKTKPLAVSFDGKNYVKPSLTTAKDKTYPVCRKLYLFYTTDNEAKVKGLVDFILSSEGQKEVEKAGYIPL